LAVLSTEVSEGSLANMAHEIDDIGLPIDPELRRLQMYLGYLAADWGTYESEERQREIVKEYHRTFNLLYSLGWDGIIAFESELPEELMPEEYLKRHPEPHSDQLTLSPEANKLYQELKKTSLDNHLSCRFGDE
jgi:hypothetical protein